MTWDASMEMCNASLTVAQGRGRQGTEATRSEVGVSPISVRGAGMGASSAAEGGRSLGAAPSSQIVNSVPTKLLRIEPAAPGGNSQPAHSTACGPSRQPH